MQSTEPIEETAAFPFPTTASWSPLNPGNATDCEYFNHIHHLLYVTVMVTAGSSVVFLNMLQMKWHCKDFHWLVTPVTFLGPTPFRIIYCVIMSCWGADLLQSVADRRSYFRSEHGLLDAFDYFVLSPAVIILSQALAYFPVFACIDPPVPLIGHAMGLAYTLLLAAKNIFAEAIKLQGCSYHGRISGNDMIISLCMMGPVFILYLVIAGWFFFHTALDATLIYFTKHKCTENFSDQDPDSDYYNHVKSLLRRITGPVHRDTLWHNFWRGLNNLFPYNRSFRYPLPFLGAVCMAFLIMYQLVVSWTGHLIVYTDNLYLFIMSFNDTIHDVEKWLPEHAHTVRFLYGEIITFSLAFKVILPVGTVMALWLLFWITVYMVQTFHKRLRNFARGDLSFLEASEPLPSLYYRLAAVMRYTAFQVAYLITTWILYVVMIVSLMSLGLIFFYGFRDFQKLAIYFWSFFMIPMMWGMSMHILQVFLCRFVFVEKTTGRFLIFRYRKLYQVLSYVFFFFNVIYGFVMCILRIFGIVIFTMVMLSRIDWDVYMRGLEGWDTGHRTFVGYMYMEYTYNNAVVRVFVRLLQNIANARRRASISDSNWSLESDEDQGTVAGNIQISNGRPPCSTSGLMDPSHLLRSIRSQRAHNRWLVAYTLLRNPTLQELTASRLQGGAIILNHHQQTDYGTL